VSSWHPRSPSSVAKCPPRVSDHRRKEWPIFRTAPSKIASQLRRFLGMLNFYKRFLPHAAAIQATVHGAFFGTITGRRISTGPLKSAIRVSRSILLAYLVPAAPLALVTDVSISAMGAVLQQRVDNAWQPFATFSRSLSRPSINTTPTFESCWLSTRP
jgi:hypothetical protein